MNIKHALVALSVAMMLAPVAASAQMIQDKAIDKHGHPIMDARGNCVLTKWQAQDDVCTGISRDQRTVYFDFNRSTIKASEKAKLDSLIKILRGSKTVASVDVVGHADMIGTNSYNQALSKKRAEAVRSYLAKAGGIKIRKVDVRALGESKPVTNCDNKLPRKDLIACLARDRRVEIMLNHK